MAGRPIRVRRATAKSRNNANGSLLDTSIEESTLKPEKTNFHDQSVKRLNLRAMRRNGMRLWAHIPHTRLTITSRYPWRFPRLVSYLNVAISYLNMWL